MSSTVATIAPAICTSHTSAPVPGPSNVPRAKQTIRKEPTQFIVISSSDEDDDEDDSDASESVSDFDSASFNEMWIEYEGMGEPV